MPDRPNTNKHPHPNRRTAEAALRSAEARRPFAELRCKTNFSFLRGASHPEELVDRAAEMGLAAIAITDRNTLAGVVRMHCAAKSAGIKLIVGAEIVPEDAPPVCLYATNRTGYANLCRIITNGRLREKKGACAVRLEDIANHHEGLLAAIPIDPLINHPAEETATSPAPQAPVQNRCHTSTPSSLSPFVPRSLSFLRPSVPSSLRPFLPLFPSRLHLLIGLHNQSADARRLALARQLSQQTGIPLIATGDVHYHEPRRRFLQDVLTCVREKCTIDQAGTRLFANAERHLKSPQQMYDLFAEDPELVARSKALANRCTFSLDELRYEYPEELAPKGSTVTRHLRELTWKGAHNLYPEGVPEKVAGLIRHELKLIEELRYEPYFLTVWDIVRFARSRDILCQGRGSAANSAVCYCLGITSVDPDRIDLLFERFVSAERNEPPDIDVDFEHQRREEVFQYIYEKYGREHAGIVAEVITYRARSAVRDVGKALGLSLDRVDALAKKHEWWDKKSLPDFAITESGLDPKDRTVRMLIKLVRELVGFPRHLSQHVGGFVITRSPLCEMVPLENGAMEGRTFIEWDKDDIDALGILKIDCLALGMLTAIHKCLKLLQKEATERRSDVATEGEGATVERRNHPVTRLMDHNATERKEKLNDECANVSGSDRLAESDGACESDLFDDRVAAGYREVRTGVADASGSRLDSIEHRGRARTREQGGLSALPQSSERIIDGATNANHSDRRVESSSSRTSDLGTPSRNRSRPPSPDPQPAKDQQRIPLNAPGSSSPSVAPSPHRSVTSALPSVASSLRRSVASSPPSSLRDIPPEDPAVYNMICSADTVGVFQIESRAQMSMLPRLKPRCFYDLVIEVAIVRPGPIQGGMVHPYLRRRNGEERITYPNDAIKEVLQRTLGVPLFQEQAMRLAVVAAGFTPGEADQLRRAMAAWRKNGDLSRFHDKLISGMRANGLSEEFAERCFKQISGFGEYGFPESHAASFALLVYVSAWLKRYHPAAFCAAIINSLPMGFYLPAQLVRDAQQHGVDVLPVDVNRSEFDCTLEEGTKGHRDAGTKGQGKRRSDGATERRRGREGSRNRGKEEATQRQSDKATKGEEGIEGSRDRGKKTSDAPLLPPFSRGEHKGGYSEGKNDRNQEKDSPCDRVPENDPQTWGLRGPAVRLGLRLIKGISEESVALLLEAREDGPFTSIADLARRSGANRSTLARLAAADAMKSIGLSRREALWDVLALHEEERLLEDGEPLEPAPRLPPLSDVDIVLGDYDATGLSLHAHPISLIRRELDLLKVRKAEVLKKAKQGTRLKVAGLVLVRQRPSTASGIVFCTLEDETGPANLIIRPKIYERYRRSARGAAILLAEGKVERQGEVVHLHVSKLADFSDALTELASRSRDFH